jgi:hypothetical protein
MDKLKQFIELEGERKGLQEKLQPLQYSMNRLNIELDELNDSLMFSCDKDFISKKIWDAFEDERKEALIELRKKRDSELLNATSFSAYQTPFDPFYDSWRLVTFERDGNKIRFQVSCRKNEGTISGLMTFLDTYWTDWFDIKELDSI